MAKSLVSPPEYLQESVVTFFQTNSLGRIQAEINKLPEGHSLKEFDVTKSALNISLTDDQKKECQELKNAIEINNRILGDISRDIKSRFLINGKSIVELYYSTVVGTVQLENNEGQIQEDTDTLFHSKIEYWQFSDYKAFIKDRIPTNVPEEDREYLSNFATNMSHQGIPISLQVLLTKNALNQRLMVCGNNHTINIITDTQGQAYLEFRFSRELVDTTKVGGEIKKADYSSKAEFVYRFYPDKTVQLSLENLEGYHQEYWKDCFKDLISMTPDKRKKLGKGFEENNDPLNILLLDQVEMVHKIDILTAVKSIEKDAKLKELFSSFKSNKSEVDSNTRFHKRHSEEAAQNIYKRLNKDQQEQVDKIIERLEKREQSKIQRFFDRISDTFKKIVRVFSSKETECSEKSIDFVDKIKGLHDKYLQNIKDCRLNHENQQQQQKQQQSHSYSYVNELQNSNTKKQNNEFYP